MKVTHVCICCGVLHDEHFQPEKNIKQIKSSSFLNVMAINALTPLLWLRYLEPLLKHSKRCVVSVFSARVGSISDNRLGGWYSYRASKAALNMMMKNVAIEWSRRAKHVKLIAFHPGTTDTALSKPFQNNVAPEKLFSPAFVAERLTNIMNNVDIDHQLSYVDWDNQSIDW